jgi:hypothetical protein
VLQLRVYGQPATVAAVVEGLDGLSGVQHLSVVETGRDGVMSLTADVGADVADSVLAVVERLDVPTDDVVLLRLDRIGPVSGPTEPLALVWADLVGQARIQARAPARYFVFMAAAGVIAAFGVIDLSSVLIVGAMAISPDLLPITAACTGRASSLAARPPGAADARGRAPGHVRGRRRGDRVPEPVRPAAQRLQPGRDPDRSDTRRR